MVALTIDPGCTATVFQNHDLLKKTYTLVHSVLGNPEAHGVDQGSATFGSNCKQIQTTLANNLYQTGSYPDSSPASQNSEPYPRQLPYQQYTRKHRVPKPIPENEKLMHQPTSTCQPTST